MENDIKLSGMSVQQLRSLAKRASALAADLEKQQPTYALALEAGVKDRSYSTTRYGVVSSYFGEAIVNMANGSKWRAVGHGPTGDAASVWSYGYIEFIPMGQ